MKYTWETHDVVPGRRFWSSNRASNGENIIGYVEPSDPKDRAKKFVLISLADGLVFTEPMTLAWITATLNDGGYRPADIDVRRWPDIAPKED